MGIKINAQQNDEVEYVKAVKEISNIIFKRALNPFKFYKFFYMLTSDYFKERKLLKILHETTASVIRKRRELLKEELNKPTEGKKRLALLDMLLQSTIDGQPLSDSDIREEVDTFMFEVIEATHTKKFCFKHFFLFRDTIQLPLELVSLCTTSQSIQKYRKKSSKSCTVFSVMTKNGTLPRKIYNK